MMSKSPPLAFSVIVTSITGLVVPPSTFRATSTPLNSTSETFRYPLHFHTFFFNFETRKVSGPVSKHFHCNLLDTNACKLHDNTATVLIGEKVRQFGGIIVP